MKKIHIYLALSISIGVLAGLMCLIESWCGSLNIPALALAPWPGFVSWALYFAIGGKPVGMGKVMASNTSGIIVAGIMLYLTALFGGSGWALALAVFLVCFILCLEAFWPPLSFIPGAFCGCACACGFGASFENPSAMVALALSMWLGAFLAWLSDLWANAMSKTE